MEHDEEFSRLEEFVEKLLVGYNTLQAECDDLRVSLSALQQENEELTATVAGQKEDRNGLYSRVSGLLSKMEAWEKSGQAAAEQQAFDPSDETPQVAPPVEQARMFVMDKKSDRESVT